MKLKNSNYTVNIFKDSIGTFHSITSNNIELGFPGGTTQTNNRDTNLSPILITISGNSLLASGSTISIEEEGIKRINLFDPFNLNISVYKQALNYLNEHNKSIAIIISSPIGTPICMYLAENLAYNIKADLPKTTYFKVDGKDLYLHHANYEVFTKPLLS